MHCLLGIQRGLDKTGGEPKTTFNKWFTAVILGSSTWARTRDLRINSPALYQLSYRGTSAAEKRNYMEGNPACQHPAFISIQKVTNKRSVTQNATTCGPSGSTRQQFKLVFHVLELVGFGQRRLGLGDARPAARQVGVQFNEVLLIPGDIFFGIDCIDRAFGDAHGAVDALVRIDREEVGTFAEAIHRAHVHAIGIAALNAAFGHNVSHSGSCILNSWGGGEGDVDAGV